MRPHDGLWIVFRWREREPPYVERQRALDLNLHPAPAVQAAGIGGAGLAQYELVTSPPSTAIITRTTPAQSGDKPPYRIPSMGEIAGIPWNGLHVVSLFCGCGGSSTGYRLAGFRVLAAVEFVPAAADSYAANKADYTTLIRGDVRELDPADLLRTIGLARGELDVLDGSPPCEPFSTAGKRDATWREVRDYSGQRQRTDDLFYEFARVLDAVQPRVFVAENVTGLIKGRAKGYYRRIMSALRSCGYDVQSRVLDASWLGVPQVRKRVIMVGVRSDLGRAPVFPVPLPYQYTVRDAIGDLLGDGSARMGSFSLKRNPPVIDGGPAPTVVAGDSTYWHVDDVEQIYKTKNFREEARPIDAPALTVVAHGPSADGDTSIRRKRSAHRRAFTIAELRRICGFPDDYVLTGSFSQQWERLGDAVPPPMAAAWAGPIAALISAGD